MNDIIIDKSSETSVPDEEIKNYVYNPVPTTNNLGGSEDSSCGNEAEDDSEGVTLAELEELEDAKIPFFSRALPKLGVTAAIFTPIFFVAWGFINGFQNPKTAADNSTDVTSESEDASQLEAENQALTEKIDELQILNGTMAQKFEDLQNQRAKSTASKASTKPKPPPKRNSSIAKKTVTPKPPPPTKTRIIKVRQPPPRRVEPQVTKRENDWERWQKISSAMVYGGSNKSSSLASSDQTSHSSYAPNTGKSVTLASLKLDSVIDSSDGGSDVNNSKDYEATEHVPVSSWEQPLLSEQPHQLIEAGTKIEGITLNPLVSSNANSFSVLTISLQEPLIGSQHEVLPPGTQLKLEVSVDDSGIVTIRNLNAYDPLGKTIALPIAPKNFTLVGRDGLPLIAKSLDREPSRQNRVERNQVLIDILTRSSRVVRNNEAAYTSAEALADKLDRQNQDFSNSLNERQDVLFIPAGTELGIFINQPAILPVEEQSLFENSDSNIPNSEVVSETEREPIGSTTNEIVEVVDYSEPTTRRTSSSTPSLESEISQPAISINQPVLPLIEEQSLYDERDEIDTSVLEASKASERTSETSMFWLQNPLS